MDQAAAQDNVKEALVTLNKMVPRLSLIHLDNELRVLTRVLYRGKSQHRRETGFQKMTKVCKQVKRCVDEDVFHTMKQLSQRHEERANQLAPHLLQAGKKLVQNAAFVKQLLSFMEKAFIDLLQQLNMNLFVPYNLVMSASLSRLWFSLKLHLTALCETNSHLQLLGELCGEHSLPQLPHSLSAVKATAPTNNTTDSFGEDLLAQRMKDFALPSMNKQPTKTSEFSTASQSKIIDTKQCYTPVEPIASQVPLQRDQLSLTHHQQTEQQTQRNQEQLKSCKARGIVLVRYKNGKTYRACVRSRRLLNQLRERKQLRVFLMSFRRYQTPRKPDRYCATLCRYSNQKRQNQDKILRSQTAIDDIFRVLVEK